MMLIGFDCPFDHPYDYRIVPKNRTVRSQLEFLIGNIYCIIPKECAPLRPAALIVYYEIQTEQKEQNW